MTTLNTDYAAVRHRHRPARLPGVAGRLRYSVRVSVTRQLSLFGAEAATPAPEDLAGLLVGPGQVVRMGGTARVSVVVEDRWRAIALVAEMRARGLEPTCVSTVDEHIGVRTPYSAVLAPIATAWLRGAIKLPPTGFAIEGRRLRLWMTAAGYRDPLGVTLRMGRCDDSVAIDYATSSRSDRAAERDRPVGRARGPRSGAAGDRPAAAGIGLPKWSGIGWRRCRTDAWT